MPRSFQLLDTLGEGAFGAVHLAKVQGDEGFVQIVAVKWLHRHLGDDGDLGRRLRDEARLLALLQHDHIVQVHGMTRIDDRLAILMEPVRGADLSRLDEPMPPRAAIEVAESVAEALHAAWETVPPGQDHPLRVVHRDIKPSNIMVTPRGGVKVMDFGVARAAFDAREARTRSQQYGTARYMAPERWMEGVAEAASDVFSLGISLLELVTGQPVEQPRLARDAFADDMQERLARLEAHPAVRELVQDMCTYDPADRPTARRVADRCHALAPDLEGAGLKQWAREWVPPHQPFDEVPAEATRVVREDISGETFQTGVIEPTLPHDDVQTLDPPSRSGRWWIPVTLAAAIMAAWFLLPGSQLVSEPPREVASGTAGTPAQGAGPAESEAGTEPADDTDDGPGADGSAPPEPALPAGAPSDPGEAAMPPGGDPGPAADDPPATVAPNAPAPAPAPGVDRSPVTFLLQPADLDVRTEVGPVSHRTAIEMPHGVHRLTIRHAGDTWRCTVLVDASLATWRVDHEARDCVQVH